MTTSAAKLAAGKYLRDLDRIALPLVEKEGYTLQAAYQQAMREVDTLRANDVLTPERA
jgi:hypothetical protein